MIETARFIEGSAKPQLVREIETKIDKFVEEGELNYYGKSGIPAKSTRLNISASLVGLWQERPYAQLEDPVLIMERPELTVSVVFKRKEVVERNGFMGHGRKSHWEVDLDNPVSRGVYLDVFTPTQGVDAHCRYSLLLPQGEIQVWRRGEDLEPRYTNEVLDASIQDLEMFKRFLDEAVPAPRKDNPIDLLTVPPRL